MDKIVIFGTSTIILLLVNLGFSIYNNPDNGIPLNDPNYVCQDRQIAYYCEGFSKYYKLPNGKCWNSVSGNALCRSGWVPIDSVVPINNTYKYIPSKGDIICYPLPRGCEKIL